ncbi:dehydrogenase/reductase SDR family member 11-like [Mya arenaria]|uniref:dehydrogenase/reductase SDR family member 11-like n=1 Tax=Mya arenaria TaxID=6604 RepID=UPI0022E53FEF|nr:dehydrogenase/reductase SDR family member 11-like [Mya arenaria]XP_052789870.1 dehydrogenase/reductase SDR family member 11-like [Mya arenaria]
MDRWVGRVALVTGMSSGIGRAIAKSLVCHGMKVVGCSRNMNRMKELVDSLDCEKGSLTPIMCDVSKEGQIQAMFEQIRSQLGGVDVCVNNAGLSHDAPLLTGATEQCRNMMEVHEVSINPTEQP